MTPEQIAKEIKSEYRRLAKLKLVEDPRLFAASLIVERAKQPLTKSGNPDRRYTTWRRRVDVFMESAMVKSLRAVAKAAEKDFEAGKGMSHLTDATEVLRRIKGEPEIVEPDYRHTHIVRCDAWGCACIICHVSGIGLSRQRCLR